MAYYGKINTGQRAAEIYRAGIKANELNQEGSLVYEGKNYNFNERNNRINRARNKAEVEAETASINILDPNKLTGPRNIRNLKDAQAARKNTLAPPHKEEPKEEEQTKEVNPLALEDEVSSDTSEEADIDQPESKP
ncbi:10791_t:CDS:2 [Paraglomus occultum]|uniref:10789_t:CDS:1 n=1 Tax=Paraglomus occultum TaxID=144539 RepID=A0A9N9FJC4_9GLOM|nr:10789_t:CDS:2 [Paraglomus occultum]CAG8537552.1 10791_t:CDS:2 [Paraglomus occultum]